MTLNAHVRLTICDDSHDLPGAFGGGCVSLLEGVAKEGSLNRAAKRMGMAYSKAWRIVREAEAHLGCKLLARDGARGSSLTVEAQKVISLYHEMQDKIEALVTEEMRSWGTPGVL